MLAVEDVGMKFILRNEPFATIAFDVKQAFFVVPYSKKMKRTLGDDVLVYESDTVYFEGERVDIEDVKSLMETEKCPIIAVPDDSVKEGYRFFRNTGDQ